MIKKDVKLLRFTGKLLNFKCYCPYVASSKVCDWCSYGGGLSILNSLLDDGVRGGRFIRESVYIYLYICINETRYVAGDEIAVFIVRRSGMR